ncbi:MAG TPA: glycosyltransferase, partial [Schlesneria sp.]
SVPYVVSPRGMMVKELIRLKSRLIKSLWILFIERRNLESAEAIHVTADIEADELEKFGFELPDILEIPNGVDTPSGSVALASSEDVRHACRMRRPMILYLGRVNWKKNLIELAQAMAHVPTGHLIVAGYDEDDYGYRVAAAAASADVQDRVTVFARPVLGTDKEALLSRCDVFVLPSLSENFGNAALEAAVRGKPLVVSEGSGVATMVREQHCGLICRPQSESIAEAINRLLSEPNMARTMGQRARNAASRQYSWPAIARSMSSAYQALIEQRVGNNSYNQTGLESEADGVLRPLGGSRRASSTVRDNAISTSSRWRE